MTSTDAALSRSLARTTRQFTVERFDGRDLAAAGWPAISAGPELAMHVFQSRAFLDVWMATIGKARGAQCFLMVVKNPDGQPVLYLPLAIETKFNVRLLRFMDAGVTDFNAPILAVNRNLTRSEFFGIWHEILSLLPQVDVVDLQKIASHVSTVRNPLTYLDCVAYESSGHSIDFGSWLDEPARSRVIARMQRKYFRRHQQLNEIGPAEFLVNPPVPQLDRIVGSLIDLKRKQYIRTSGRDFFTMPGVYEFYREMMQPSRLGCISHLSALTCGDKVVSAHLGFIGRGRFYYVLPAFDTKYRALTVGHVLLDHLIRHCAESDYATFDLGEGDFSYKKKWATHRLPLLSYEQAMTTTGLVYRQLRRVRRAVSTNAISEFYSKGRVRNSDELQVVQACRRLIEGRWGTVAARSIHLGIRTT